MQIREPRRLGMIGLSAHGASSWAAGAHLPALKTEAGKAHYKIMALCNSSTPAAKDAVLAYQLNPNEVSTYGTPEEIAADRNVEVISCNTRVDRHFETIMPSIRAGKDVFVEWPIASNTEQVAEIVAAARKSGSRVGVGLQRRNSAPILKITEILRSGRFGKVLSSEFRAYGGTRDRTSIVKGLEYFFDRRIGGNAITIGFGHAIDFVQAVLGDLDPLTTHAQVQLQRPRVAIVDGPDRTVTYETNSDVPDLISVHGTLHKSSKVVGGATLTACFRMGQPFPGHPALIWTINCERGEIRLISPIGISLESNYPDDPLTIHVHDYTSEIVERIPWSWTADEEALPPSARAVQRCLLAFAEGNRDGYVDLEDAAKRAMQIFGWLGK